MPLIVFVAGPLLLRRTRARVTELQHERDKLRQDLDRAGDQQRQAQHDYAALQGDLDEAKRLLEAGEIVESPADTIWSALPPSIPSAA